MDSDDTGTLPASDDAPVDETVDVDVDVAAGEDVAIELAPISDPIGTARRRHGLAEVVGGRARDLAGQRQGRQPGRAG